MILPGRSTSSGLTTLIVVLPMIVVSADVARSSSSGKTPVWEALGMARPLLTTVVPTLLGMSLRTPSSGFP